MGIMGWARCYWCWRWEYNPACPDFQEGPEGEQHHGPLCDTCLDLWMGRRRPPWKPTAVNRAAEVVGAALGPKLRASAVYFIVAEFLEPWDKP